MRYLVAAIPGLGPVVSRALEREAGVQETTTIGSDGRTDLVVADLERGAGPPNPPGAEDVFVWLGEARGVRGLRDLLDRIWDEQVEGRALSVYATAVAPLRTRMGYRVIARVRSEAMFKRTELRAALTERIAQIHPRWRVEDPAPLEFWIAETKARTFVLGLRLTLGPRSTRVIERPGALRPSVARAMVWLAGKPDGVLLDPFCGTGTILEAADGAGWRVAGADIDPGVLPVARRNAGAAVARADAMRMPFRDNSVRAVVSNMPFGKRFVQPRLMATVFGEIARVLRHGGRGVLLVPGTGPVQRAIAVTQGVRLLERVDVDLLGLRTAVWVLARD